MTAKGEKAEWRQGRVGCAEQILGAGAGCMFWEGSNAGAGPGTSGRRPSSITTPKRDYMDKMLETGSTYTGQDVRSLSIREVI